MVDALPAKVFQGIPGIDMDMRLSHYYRVNYTPIFITERTPSKNREGLWKLLESVGLDYYDRFEWLLRTNMKAANDNLIVEKRRMEQKVVEYTADIINDLQYGDKVIIDSIESLGNTSTSFSNNLFTLVTNGVDIVTREGLVLIDINSRYSIVNIAIASRLLKYQEYVKKQQNGIDKAKKEGKYQGRKPIVVDEEILREVVKELDKGIINVAEAMRRTGINSRSTFYRKLKKYDIRM